MDENRSANYVELCGTADADAAFSHENHAQQFYTFPLCVERLSGQNDLPQIVVPAALMRMGSVCAGERLRVTGQLRSFNNKSGQGRRLILSVFAQTLERTEDEASNRILLTGTICKTPVLRRTPLGRSICDIIVAVNRRYGRADYLPCIAWGQVAQIVSEMEVGQVLSLEGRVQSRIYSKQMPDGTLEQRTAYEVSIMQLLAPPEAETV